MTTLISEWCFVAALSLLLLARRSWVESTERSGKAFEVMLVFMGVWLLGYGFELTLAEFGLPIVLFGFVLKQIGFLSVPICLSMFSLFYAGLRPTFGVIIVLNLPFVLGFAALISNPSSNWYYQAKGVEPAMWEVDVLLGQPGWAMEIAQYFHPVVTGVSLAALALQGVRRNRAYWEPMRLTCIAFLLPIFALLVNRLMVDAGLDLVAISLGLTVPLLYRAVALGLLHQSPNAWMFAFDQIEDPVIVTDVNGRIIQANSASERLFGEALEGPLALRASDQVQELEIAGRVFNVRSGRLQTDTGTPGTTWILRDISERKRLERELLYQANHDSLTGLANYRALQTYLEQLKHGRLLQPVGLVMLDIDNFRLLNNRRSHEVGNRVLTQFAELIRMQLRDLPNAVAYRFGGDEFCIVLPGFSLEYTEDFMEHLRLEVKQFFIMQTLEPGELSVSAGVAAAPGQPLDALLHSASSALHQAKGSGKDRVLRAGKVTVWPRGALA